MTKLLDILACPICKVPLELHEGTLLCTQQGHRYPVINGVPILFPEADQREVCHEAPLDVREEYAAWVHRNVLRSLANNQVVLDVGSGNVTVNDPNIVRMDVTLTPYVDIVADVHALPFLDESLDYVMSLAVLEHLHQPFVASQEMYRVLKRGGYVYADTNFVFCYHGYPHHYFNFSIHGIQRVFADFTMLQVGVPPHQMPSYAVENLISTYMRYFKPSNHQEEMFYQVLQEVMQYPLQAYDAKFTPDTAFRLSAGVFYLGLKKIAPDDTLIPLPVMEVYAQTPALQARYPTPGDITLPDNLMLWAKREGRYQYPSIATYLDACQVLEKSLVGGEALGRDWINSLPLVFEAPTASREATVSDEPGVAKAPERTSWWQLPGKALRVLRQQGLRGLLRNVLEYLLWRLYNPSQ